MGWASAYCRMESALVGGERIEAGLSPGDWSFMGGEDESERLQGSSLNALRRPRR